jgi:Putative peptidoglycan binding domain
MPDLYVPGAELHLLDDAPMAGDGGARVIWHVTWDKNASASAPQDLVSFGDLVSYFSGAGRGSAPHVIWDPFTGRIAQFFSARSRSKSVVNAPGGVETNRKGDFCAQVEILFFPYCRVNGRVYATVADTPCVGLDRIMAWLRSWGVPDVWPMGAPDWSSHRSSAVWDSQSGHYGHSQIPENDHTDPGPMPALFAASPQPAPQPAPAPNPPAGPVWPGRYLRVQSPMLHGDDVREWQQRMHGRGWPIGVDGWYGNQSAGICRQYQSEKGLAVDGVVGPATWASAFRTDNVT